LFFIAAVVAKIDLHLPSLLIT